MTTETDYIAPLLVLTSLCKCLPVCASAYQFVLVLTSLCCSVEFSSLSRCCRLDEAVLVDSTSASALKNKVQNKQCC